MLHARLFAQDDNYRRAHFQPLRPGSSEPWLDGNPALDRPLFVQFCANEPSTLLAAARLVAPHCDAVDLNLGCPQGIARKGHYGAFLQEDQDLIFRLINTLHKELSVPVTAKIRILESKEKTLAYARLVLDAGASILTVHGRTREQKGHLTGVADWETIAHLRAHLPPETVLFANGNILQAADVERCLEATGADAVMSAEGILSDPAIFASPPSPGDAASEAYWRGGAGDADAGWRVDALMRRYLDILHRYALGTEPPTRRPLFVPGHDTAWLEAEAEASSDLDPGGARGEPDRKRRRKGPADDRSFEDKDANGEHVDDKHVDSKHSAGSNQNGSPPRRPSKDDASPNLSAVQPHLFHLLRHLVTRHTDVRDMLARSRRGGLASYEHVLAAVERRVAKALLAPAAESTWASTTASRPPSLGPAVARCRRPWWLAQPIVRPLPAEALAKGAITLSKKQKAAAAAAVVP